MYDIIYLVKFFRIIYDEIISLLKNNYEDHYHYIKRNFRLKRRALNFNQKRRTCPPFGHHMVTLIHVFVKSKEYQHHISS